MSDVIEHSKEAWAIASQYSHVLASETRDLAAQIDAAIASLREERDAARMALQATLARLGTCKTQVQMLIGKHGSTDPWAKGYNSGCADSAEAVLPSEAVNEQ